MRISIGDYHAGPYCGEQVWRVRGWLRRYGWFRRTTSGFSIGPILFWKEHIR